MENIRTDNNRKSKNQTKGNDISNLLFAQIVVVILVLIIFLTIKLISSAAYSGMKSEYNKYFDKDVPISVISNKIQKYLFEEEGEKDKEQKTNLPKVVKIEPTTNAQNTTQPSTSADETENTEPTSLSKEEIEDTLVSASKKEEPESLLKKLGAGGSNEDTLIEGQKSASGMNEMAVPVIGKVSSHFGFRIHPITGKYAFHGGLDIAAPEGTDIVAALDGTVTASVYDESLGNYIKIAHSDSVVTAYGHCSKLLVKEGEKVKKGQVIAKVGSTGNSTGPHTHFEIRINGVKIDPQWILPKVE